MRRKWRLKGVMRAEARRMAAEAGRMAAEASRMLAAGQADAWAGGLIRIDMNRIVCNV